MHQAEIQTANPLLANTNLESRAMHLAANGVGDLGRQRQRRALFDLDEHRLRDIGKTREEALKEAHKLFWK